MLSCRACKTGPEDGCSEECLFRFAALTTLRERTDLAVMAGTPVSLTVDEAYWLLEAVNAAD